MVARTPLKLNGGDDNGRSRVRVVFNNIEKKRQIMKAKKKLKGNEMWIGDDLTSYRSNLAYHARQAVKSGQANQTWVTEGKIFLKRTAKAKPETIHTIQDIPGRN
jgi:hypothetical protein